MREGRDSVVLPSSLLQERRDDDDKSPPPHRMLEQLECSHLSTCKSGRLQVMLVEGLNTSTFLSSSSPPVMRNPLTETKYFY